MFGIAGTFVSVAALLPFILLWEKKRAEPEHVRFTGDNWLPEKPAYAANQSLIIACHLLQESSMLI